MKTEHAFTPQWAQDAVFYELIPDRFADAKRRNDGRDSVPFGSDPVLQCREGGDLAGVARHLNYLQDLGINAIYFTPLFTAHSYHGYDIDDFYAPDPHLGTEEELKHLLHAIHQRGWHVLLDIVFTHTGIGFKAFESLRRLGKRSGYKDWYFVHHFPIEVKDGQDSYDGWRGTPMMPLLNFDNPKTRQYLLGVARHWIKTAPIDGWRVDSTDLLSHDFLRELRKAVKSARSDAFLLGEFWPPAHELLQGDMLDSVTNYRWRGPVLDFLANDILAPTQFDGLLQQIREDYPPDVTPVLFNMLASHDTERLRTACNKDWRKVGQAVLFQMTYPGAPCIYYGDEIGLEGGKDPQERQAMVWDEQMWDRGLLAYYKKVLALRRDHEVLRRGDYRTVLVDDSASLFGFARTNKNGQALVLFNRSEQRQQVCIPLADLGTDDWHDWFGDGKSHCIQGNDLLIDLTERGFALLGTEPAVAK